MGSAKLETLDKLIKPSLRLWQEWHNSSRAVDWMQAGSSLFATKYPHAATAAVAKQPQRPERTT